MTPERPKSVIPRVPGGGSRPNPNEVPHLERGGRQIDTILHVRRDDLRPEVREYTDNLKEQILNILRAHHVRTSAEFAELARKKKVTEAQAEAFAKLMHAFAAAVRSNERPGDAEAREAGKRLLERAYEDASKIADDQEASEALAVVGEELYRAGFASSTAFNDAASRLNKISENAAGLRAAVKVARHMQNADFPAEGALEFGRSRIQGQVAHFVSENAANEAVRSLAEAYARSGGYDAAINIIRGHHQFPVPRSKPRRMSVFGLTVLTEMAAGVAASGGDPKPFFKAILDDTRAYPYRDIELLNRWRLLADAETKAGYDAEEALVRFREELRAFPNKDDDYHYALYRARAGILDGEALERVKQSGLRAAVLLAFEEHAFRNGDKPSAATGAAIRTLLAEPGSGLRPQDSGDLLERRIAMEIRAGLEYRASLGSLKNSYNARELVPRLLRLADVVSEAGGDPEELLMSAKNHTGAVGTGSDGSAARFDVAEAFVKHHDVKTCNTLLDWAFMYLPDPTKRDLPTWPLDAALRGAAIAARVGGPVEKFLKLAWEYVEADRDVYRSNTARVRVVAAEAQYGDTEKARDAREELDARWSQQRFDALLGLAAGLAERGEDPTDDFGRAHALLLAKSPYSHKLWKELATTEARAGAALIKRTSSKPNPGQ